MKILSCTSLLLLSLLGADVARADAPKSAANDPSNDFTFAMYGKLKKGDGNVFFSGTSLREALGIAYLGARGQTASEMSTALRLDGDVTKSAASAKDEISGWNAARGKSELSIANRLWFDTSFHPTASFANASRDAYGAPSDPIDFSRAPDPSRLTINRWVAGQTHDHVKDLLPAGSIKSDTRVVVTNAIFFKGDWARAFKKEGTYAAPFAIGGKTDAKVPTMHQTSFFGFAHVGGVKVLEMRYQDSDLAMDIVLPDAKDGLPKIEGSLSAGTFATWTSSLQMERVDVAIPKLEFSWGAEMNDSLKALGMRTAFVEGEGDFSGIASPSDTGGKLFVSAVFHKAFVAVDEKGTEAAAATAVVIGRESITAIEPPAQKFEADHPFLFAIRDVKRGRVLFMGRVQDPRGS